MFGGNVNGASVQDDPCRCAFEVLAGERRIAAALEELVVFGYDSLHPALCIARDLRRGDAAVVEYGRDGLRLRSGFGIAAASFDLERNLAFGELAAIERRRKRRIDVVFGGFDDLALGLDRLAGGVLRGSSHLVALKELKVLAVDAECRRLLDVPERTAVGHDGHEQERHAVVLVRHGEHDRRPEVVEELRGDAHVFLRCLRVLVGEPPADRESERQKRPDGHCLARGRGAVGTHREEAIDQVPCGTFANLHSGFLDGGGEDLPAGVNAVAIGHELCAIAAFLAELRRDGGHFVLLVSAHLFFPFLFVVV